MISVAKSILPSNPSEVQKLVCEVALLRAADQIVALASVDSS
jgi:hypothetical protein